MAYIQKNNPFPITSCGRRRTFTQGGNPGNDRTKESPFNKLRKTTRGKGKHFLHADEGAGMTEAGRKAYKKENPGSTLSAPVTGKVKPGSKAAKRRKSFCARSRGWTGERGKAARRRWRC
tara:strand:- start:129 stop:488 length:360 start_codon:yes stop_codon:yes gene_type:complete